MWIWTANKFTKFHTKRLNWSENIPKSFRGLLFSETFFLWYKTSVLWCQSLAWVNWNSCNRKSIHHKMSGERGYCSSARCQCDVPALLYASEWGGWALPLEGHIKIAWKYSTTAVVQAHLGCGGERAINKNVVFLYLSHFMYLITECRY